MKLAIALQFYDGDKAQAMRLARMIANIQFGFQTDVEFIFVARYDCEHDQDTIGHVARKFRVHWITTHTQWRGWPAGPNAMARDLIEWVAANRKDCEGLLMIEPDCVPIDRNWFDIIFAKWISQPRETMMMGAWRSSGGADGHLNGNCVINPRLFSSFNLPKNINQHIAWDCSLAPFLKNYWHKTDLIQNCFESKDATDEKLDQHAVLIHGFKDDSCYELARNRIKL